MDKRIPELSPKSVITGDMMFIMYDQATDTSYRVNLNQIVGDTTEISIWQPDPAIYNTDDLVISDDRIWKSLVDGNVDNPPEEGSFWTEVSKSTIPSSDLIIQDVAHGFSEGDWLTIKAGIWDLCDAADVALGYVKTVIDADSFSFVSKYQRSSILGVTPFQYYYHENGGVVDAGPATQIAFVAFSNDEVFLLSGVGGGGGGGSFLPLSLTGDTTVDGNNYNLSFDNLASFQLKTFDDNILLWATNANISLYSEDSPASSEWVRIGADWAANGLIISDNRAVATGIEYQADYSANYTLRSLVDREYVDNAVGGGLPPDPGYNSILGWDDTDNAIKHFILGAGFSYNAGTDTISIGSGAPYWPLSGAASITAPVTINGSTGNGISWSSQASWNINFLANQGLSLFTGNNAGLSIGDFGNTIQMNVDQTFLMQQFISSGNANIITDLAFFRKRNSSAGANGIGQRILFQNSSTTGTTYRSNVLESVLTNANPAASRGELRFGVAENAAYAIKLIIDEFGAKYNADYSANYTARSLVDKAYADAAVATLQQDNVTLSIYKLSNFGTP